MYMIPLCVCVLNPWILSLCVCECVCMCAFACACVCVFVCVCVCTWFRFDELKVGITKWMRELAGVWCVCKLFMCVTRHCMTIPYVWGRASSWICDVCAKFPWVWHDIYVCDVTLCIVFMCQTAFRVQCACKFVTNQFFCKFVTNQTWHEAVSCFVYNAHVCGMTVWSAHMCDMTVWYV